MYSKTSPLTFNLSFFLAILGLLGIFGYTGIVFNALIKSNELVSHTLIVLGKLDETLAHIADAESGVRGYVITGDEVFLDPYYLTLDPQEGVHTHLAELRQLTADNPRQQAQLARLEELVNNKMAMFNRNIELRRQEGFEAAWELVATRDGKEKMDAIRSIIEEMRAEEFVLLQTRSESASKNLRNVLWISAVGAPFMLTLMVASFFLLERQIRERRKAEDDLRQLNADLDRRVAERTAALAESERNYRALVQRLPDMAVFLFDREMRFLIVGGPALASAGFNKEAMEGKTLYEAAPLDRVDALEEKYHRVLQGETIRYDALWNNRIYDSQIVPTFDENGKVIGGMVVAQDVTERKQAEQALAESYDRLAKTTAHIPGFVFQFCLKPDGSTCVPYASAGIQDVYEVTAEQVKEDAAPIFKTIHPDEVERVTRNIMESAQRLTPWHEENRIVLPSGKTKWVEGHSTPQKMEDGSIIWYGFTQDITERKRAEEEIKRLATYNKLVLESVGEGIVGIDKNGIITFVNPSAARFFGESREDLIGTPFHDLHHHTRADGTPYPREESLIYAAFHDNTTHHVDDQVFWRADGTSFPVEYTSTPFRNESGEIAGAVVVFKDITERKRAEEQNRFFTNLVASTSDAIIVVDMRQNIQSWNKGAETIYGWKEMEVLGRPAKDILDTDFLKTTRETVNREILEKGHWSGEVLHLHRDGTRIPVQSSISLNKDSQGRPIGIVAVNRDITAHKRAEEERFAREVAERASQAKSEFLSRMSHEFRTPLNAILGFAQLLKMDPLPPAQERGVEQIYKAGRHLLDLVNEVLDIARIEAGRMTISPEPVRVADTVNEVFDLIRPMAEDRHISLTFKIPSSSDVFVEADRQRFKQVLLNLFSNAVKYNREGGAIEVTASLTIGGYLRLQVRDTGAGIPPEKMERLFVPFDRLDTDAAEGTGLGLALSKGLVEAMGGRIGAESTVGEGSTFWLELKLVTDRLKEVIMAEVDENLSENMCQGRGVVLYVEDNLANINLVEAIMERIPEVKLITAMQGRLALDLAKEHQPNLILLDLHLPDMHGSEVLRRLKAEPATQAIPVVVISADAMPSHMNDLLALGAKGYLTKPIDVKEFLKVIEDAVDKPKDF